MPDEDSERGPSPSNGDAREPDGARGAGDDAGHDEGIGSDGGYGPDGDEARDELPEDLDPTALVGPYLFPDNSRRRVPGYLYFGVAAICVILWLATLGGAPVLVNGGFLGAAVALAAIGVFHLLAGWHLEVDERDALVIAARTLGFAAGHASAQMGWRGFRSRPTWRILLYSAENPALQRGLVLIDGIDGEVVSWFKEPNPEDWTGMAGGLEG